MGIFHGSIPMLIPMEQSPFIAAAPTNRLSATNRKLAYKFYADRASPITHVSAAIGASGTVTSTNFTLEILSDSADIPGTLLGSGTSAFAGQASATSLPELALGSNTGSLTVGHPYWLVMSYASGTAPDSGNYIFLRQTGTPQIWTVKPGGKLRVYDGTDWTTTAGQNGLVLAVFRHADGSYSGLPRVADIASPAAITDIFGTNRQALKVSFPVAWTPRGFGAQITKTGSPGNLEIAVYEGSSQKFVETISANEITTNANGVYPFTAPLQLAANSDCYFVLRQEGNAGSDSADYDWRIWAITNAAFIDAAMPLGARLCHGTGDDPTVYAASESFAPLSCIFLAANDFAGASSGGVMLPAGFNGGFGD